MIRLAKTLLTFAAFVLALTATAQASTITVDFTNQVGSDFVYTISFEHTGLDISLSPSESIVISGFGADFTGSVAPASNEALEEFFNVVFDGGLNGGSFVVTPLSTFLVEGASTSLELTVSAPGFTGTTNAGSFFASFSLEGTPETNSGPGTSGPGLLVPIAQAPVGAAAPEPSTLALGLIGLAGLAVARRRMK